MIQALSNDNIKYKVTGGINYSLWFFLTILYVLTWIVVDGDMGLAPRLGVAIVFMIFMLTSYANAVAVMLMVIFVPIVTREMGQEIGGVKLTRLVFIVFLYLSIKRQSLRKLQFDKSTFNFLMISTIVIIFFSYVQLQLQNEPLSVGMKEAKGLKNYIASFIDQLIIISFFIISYIKLNFKQLDNLYNTFIFIVVLQALNILYMVAIRPEAVFFGPGFDILYLWNSKHFGHKNDWGMMFVFIFFATFIKMFLEPKHSKLYLIAMGIFLAAIAVSQSRQAYVWTVMGFIMVSIWQKNTKIIAYFILIAIAIVIIQPAFLMERMESMLAVDSLEDAKSINRKISDLSINQAISYFTFVPRVFIIDWEYNWSEGFWVGLLHNTGIIGFFTIIYMYFYFFTHYRRLFKTNNNKLSTYGMLVMTYLVLMFLANANRRFTHFVHYKGTIGQIGMIVMFIMFYTELMFHSLRKKIPFVTNL